MRHFTHFRRKRNIFYIIVKGTFGKWDSTFLKQAHLVNVTFGKWQISLIFAEFRIILQMFLKGTIIKRHIRQMANLVNGTYPTFFAEGEKLYKFS